MTTELLPLGPYFALLQRYENDKDAVNNWAKPIVFLNKKRTGLLTHPFSENPNRDDQPIRSQRPYRFFPVVAELRYQLICSFLKEIFSDVCLATKKPALYSKVPRSSSVPIFQTRGYLLLYWEQAKPPL